LAKSKKVKKAVAAKRAKISQADFPVYNLQEALVVAQAIWDNFAGKAAAPHQIAQVIDKSPSSSDWRYITGASIGYGLTEGGSNAPQITLKELGKRIVASTKEGDDIRARAEAVLKPTVMGDFFRRYNRAKFPRDEIVKNVLVELGIPKERAENAFAILKANGEYAGIIQQMKTGPFVAIDDPSLPAASLGDDVDDGDEVASSLEDNEGTPEVPATLFAAAKPTGAKPKQLFVAHGKKHKPLDDLKKILNEFKIPYKVAIDEANKGRPISGKVAELMNECSAGIFIFTKDEKFFVENAKGEHDEIWRPSENVVYELGAANILWEKKIIIVREDGVNFPSDFRDLGYI
jgi:hypothetical protein